MTQVSSDEVRHLAQLSSLSLTDDEVTTMADEMTAILGYVDQLSELDTAGVAPTYQVTDLRNVWRDDRVDTSTVNPDELLAMAPDLKDHQVKVPKVL